MKWLFEWVLTLALLPLTVLADEGHGGHGAPPLAPPTALAPRIEAQSESFELLAVLDGGKLTLYLDRFATNEPVSNARIEIESGAFKAVAQPGADGVYTASGEAFAEPGPYPLVFTIQAADSSDLLNGTLTVPRPAGQSARGHGWAEWLVWITGSVVVLFGSAWLLLRRRRTSRAAIARLAAVFALATLMAAAAVPFSHAGENRGNDKKAPSTAITGVSVAYSAGDNASARRLADGGVFMPKAMQRQLGIRTTLAESGELAQSIELNGRVISDPNAGGRVQASQSGRIEPGPHGLATLGQKVKKGDVLAYIKPVANAIELGNQRAQLAEITAQHGLTEKKVKRLEALEGSVPQKEIDAARAEFASLAERKTAVSASLNHREALVAPASGVISAASAVTGQVVEAREVLFEIVDPQRLLVEALAYDPAILADIAGASAVLPHGASLPLAFVGGAQQLREQALPLVFRIKPPLPPLVVGQPLKVVAQTRRTARGVALPLAALTRSSASDTVAWVHAGAETFVAKKVRFQALDGATVAVIEGIAAGDRVVTAGAAALAQVR
jgi:biotin carboxyl carrier protein